MKQTKYLINAGITFILLIFLSTGCWPDRDVTDPDYNVKDVRRPDIEFSVPAEEAVNISRTTDIVIWFDELMDESSVMENFLMWPVVKLDSNYVIAVDPNDPSTMYIGKQAQGIFKTTDGAQSWQWASKNDLRTTINDLVIAPSNSDVLYAATNEGVYKSFDAGLHWEGKSNGLVNLEIQSICVASDNPDLVFLSTFNQGVYKSADGGENWDLKSQGIPLDRTIYRVNFDAQNNSVLYLGTAGNYVLKTEDGGESWKRIRSGFSTRDILTLAVDPSNSDIVYAGTIDDGIYKTVDGGLNWTKKSSGITNPEITALKVFADDSENILVSTKKGIFYSLDGAESWQPVSMGYTRPLILDIIPNPQNFNEIFAINIDGVFKNTISGDTWSSASRIDFNLLYVQGAFEFTTWQDSTIVIYSENGAENDSSVIHPYVLERALVGWDGNGEPAVDPNPKATKMIYKLSESLLPGWLYQVRIRGTFESDKETLQGSYGARDIDGNSFETDDNFTFTTTADE